MVGIETSLEDGLCLFPIRRRSYSFVDQRIVEQELRRSSDAVLVKGIAVEVSRNHKVQLLVCGEWRDLPSLRRHRVTVDVCCIVDVVFQETNFVEVASSAKRILSRFLVWALSLASTLYIRMLVMVRRIESSRLIRVRPGIQMSVCPKMKRHNLSYSDVTNSKFIQDRGILEENDAHPRQSGRPSKKARSTNTKPVKSDAKGRKEDNWVVTPAHYYSTRLVIYLLEPVFACPSTQNNTTHASLGKIRLLLRNDVGWTEQHEFRNGKASSTFTDKEKYGEQED